MTMDEEITICPICHHNLDNSGKYEDHMNDVEIDCNYCGKYTLHGWQIKNRFPTKNNENHPDEELSIIIRQHYEQDNKRVIITENNLDELRKSIYIPNNPIELIDKIMQYINNKVKYIHETINIPFSDSPLLFLKNQEELQKMLKFLSQLKYINYRKYEDGFKCSLRLGGWEYLLKLKSKLDSKQVFVAMRISDDMELKNLYDNAISPAIIDTGFTPCRIDMKEHNEKICDKIIAEIKKSNFMVADFTGQSCNVYYEAGFAMGLGKTVIFCCKKDEVENLKFDTRQYNHILWDNIEGLKKALIDRISATIKK